MIGTRKLVFVLFPMSHIYDINPMIYIITPLQQLQSRHLNNDNNFYL